MSSEDERLKKAFENPDYKWRTVRGVAKETGVSKDSVEGYLSTHGDHIVKSSSRNKKGEPLYTSRKSYRAKAGVLKRISSVMKNRGG